MRKVAAKKSPVKRVNGKSIPKQEKKQPPAKVVMVRVQLDVMVSVGQDDERSYEEFREDVVSTLKDENGPVRAKNATITSGYYLVDGRVCLPDDYDPKTRGFKAGARPPMWASSPDEQKIAARIEREKSLPEIARQPTHLRTSTETDEYHALLKKDPEAAREHRKNEVKKSLEGIPRRTQLVEDDVDEIEEFDEEEIEEIEDEWGEGDEFDEDAADEVVSTSSSSILAKLRAKKAAKSK